MDCPNYPLTELPVGSTISPAASPNVLPTRTLRDYTHLQIFYTPATIAGGQTLALALVAVAPDGTTHNLFQTNALSAGSDYVFNYGPGVTLSGTIGSTVIASYQGALPRSWFIQEIFTDTSGTKAVTRSLSWVGSRQ